MTASSSTSFTPLSYYQSSEHISCVKDKPQQLLDVSKLQVTFPALRHDGDIIIW